MRRQNALRRFRGPKAFGALDAQQSKWARVESGSALTSKNLNREDREEREV
jgi:hypothetical protein